MKTYSISFYEQFKCLADKCPEHCCRGWMIPLTNEDVQRYEKEPGLLGIKLFFATGGRNFSNFNNSSRKCPFHKRGLCSLQRKYGHWYIPEVCRRYPRFFRNYGSFQERYLDLSCINVAMLFAENTGNMHLVQSDEKAECGLSTSNDDKALLSQLVKVRSDVVKAFSPVDSFEKLGSMMKGLDSYMLRAQDAFLAGQTDFFAGNLFPGADSGSLFPLPLSAFNRLITTDFYHQILASINPFLHSLCRLYFDDFERELSSQALLDLLTGDFMKAHPEKARFYTAYFIYYLYQNFLGCHETYSFRKQVRLGIVHTNMVFLFEVLYEKKHGPADETELARIIAVYNKRAFFSAVVLDQMYKASETETQAP